MVRLFCCQNYALVIYIFMTFADFLHGIQDNELHNLDKVKLLPSAKHSKYQQTNNLRHLHSTGCKCLTVPTIQASKP